MRNVLKKSIILLIFYLGFSLDVFASEHLQEIKVGYVPDYGTLKSEFTDEAEGYGYEYLSNLVNYMDGAYMLTFVACSNWQEGLDKLDCGEIDILGPTIKIENSDYLYTINDFGSCTFMLAKLTSSNDDIYELDNTTIAIPDYYLEYSCLTNYLEVEDIDASIISISSQNLNITIGLEDIDYVWMSSLQNHAGLTTVTRLDSCPVYYIATLNNQGLIDEMDYALSVLEEAEPYFEYRLSLKYNLDSYSGNAYISDEKLALIQEKGVYRVGIRNFYSPLVRESVSGELEGVAFTLLDTISEKAGITFEYILLDNESSQEEIDSADFLIATTDFTEGLGFPYESSVYLELPFLLLEHRESSSGDVSTQNIGIADYYCAESYMEDGMVYGREVIKYRTVQDLQQAFDAGEIDSMLITIVSLNMIRDDFEKQDYVTSTVEDSLKLRLAFSDNMSDDEMAVFNKLISTVDQTVLEEAILEYAIINSETTLESLVEDKPEIVVGIVIIIILTIVVGAGFTEYRRKFLLIKSLNIDELTGLSSQRKFKEDAIAVLKENSQEVCEFVSIDIDNFKYINEMYGYEIGNKLLKLVAAFIQKNILPDTLLARFGSDNFVLMLRTSTCQESLLQWKLFDEQLQKEIEYILKLACRIDFSIGIYKVVDTTLDINVMIDYANIARQSEKGTTGFSCHYFTEKMAAERVTNNQITVTMFPAIQNEEFVLYYQPKIDLNTHVMVGAEVLVRWIKNGTVMPPNKFVPLFEKNGFIKMLDYYVLRHTCLFLQGHRECNIPRLSVNISGATLLQQNVVHKLLDIVNSYEISPSEIDIEITETAFVENGAVLKSIKELRSYGFTISMDDFGTGVSSLDRLKNMQLDTIKIDRGFIIDAIDNERGNQILQSVVQLAKGLKLETVAEGIETEEQQIFLEKLGCDVGQGYFFSHPLQEDDFIIYCKESCSNLT